METRTGTYFDLLEACRKPGCPLCRLSQDGAERYLSALLYESVNDPGVRSRLQRSLGFCREHARLILDRKHGEALGVAILTRDLLQTALERIQKTDGPRPMWLRRAVGTRERFSELARRLTPHQPCPVCRQRDVIAERTLDFLLKSPQDEPLGEALRTSDGLCLPHLRRALTRSSSPESLEALLTASAAGWERLQGELAEFIRKNDYRFQAEDPGGERDSWLRATAILSGIKPVN
jgi:hypothetical protein